MKRLIALPLYEKHRHLFYYTKETDEYERLERFKVSSLKYIEYEAIHNKKKVLVDCGLELYKDEELRDRILNFKNRVEMAGGTVVFECFNNKRTSFYFI